VAEGNNIQQAVTEAKELVRMLETSSVRRLVLASGDFKIVVDRTGRDAASGPATVVAGPAGAAATTDQRHRVLSPMVGTFYHARSPGAKPFIAVGGRVERGQTIGIVEAMKVMNEVPSDAAGVVVEILVPDGQSVQFEQPLVVIDTQA